MADQPFEVLTMAASGRHLPAADRPVAAGRRELRQVPRRSATNVAVAAARYGRRSAVISRTGQDPFGDYIHDALRGFSVDDRFVTAVPSLPTR